VVVAPEAREDQPELKPSTERKPLEALDVQVSVEVPVPL
jgi:hypothetical protein